ncbi:MAG: MmgE/PrpD family protein [Candidatus Marinimicrobia bacterium]|nr:MmgE/PrpD family protein [Candidatus Neomarinimicrobiota bacterium]
MDISISRKMARFALELQYADLPLDVVGEVKRYLYDSVGCAFGGFNTRDVQIMRRVYRHMSGLPEASLFVSGDQIPAVSATLVNSLAVRALDYNDIYWREDPCHPSDLIPAALAVGEMTGATMKHVIVAIVLAYEFEQRLCEFALPGIRERKWHHATLTQFVAPIVAGKLMGLSEDQLVNAIGIAGSHSYTVGAVTAGQLTMMKNTVDPMAVRDGVFAAQLAEHDYTGPEEIFEGKEGFMDTFGPDWDVDKLVGRLGESFKILECSMKAFPTEALTHTHISATLQLVKEHDIQPEQVEEVVVTTIARATDILFDHHKYEPSGRETADHSLPFCIARAILDREITTRTFDDDKIADPQLKAIIRKIKGEASEEFEQLFPAKQPSRVTIRTTAGQEHSVYLEYPKGDPREPMTEEDQDSKFRGLTAPYLSDESRQRIKETIFTCDTLSGVKQFMAVMIED